MLLAFRGAMVLEEGLWPPLWFWGCEAGMYPSSNLAGGEGEARAATVRDEREKERGSEKEREKGRYL